MEYQGKIEYSTQGKYPSLIELNELAENRGFILNPVRLKNKTVFDLYQRKKDQLVFKKRSKEYNDHVSGRIKILAILYKNNLI